MVERQCVPAFGRSMAEEQMIEQPGMNLLGTRGGSGRDEAVDDDRDVGGGAAEAYAGHRGDLETAERGEERFAGGERVAMELECTRDHLGLAADAGVVQPGAAADDRGGRNCGERGQDRGGGRA